MRTIPKMLRWSWLVVLLGACFEPRTAVELRVVDQDINETESDAADRAIAALLAQDNVAFVLCRRQDAYEVHGRAGKIAFQRLRDEEGWRYEVVSQSGTNPLARQDPAALPDLQSELAAGDNPLKTDYTKQDSGYTGPDDPRIAFLKEERVSYPLAYERIAAMFDGEHTGDLVVEFTPWGWYPLGDHDGVDTPGAHGPLGVVPSRAPLILAGKGARRKQVIAGWARSVDIAPTVAKAMGIAPTFGVDETGHYRHDLYLKWQDGHVLEQALDGATADHVVILVNDALTHSELMHQLAGTEKLTTYRWLVDNGTLFGHGAIVNFPTNTFASQNTIGSGAYSGHHGLIDNWFYNRKTRKRHDPLTQVFDTGKLLTDEIETLHEAVHRSFSGWDPDRYPLGNFTASMNNPSTRGADLALLEGVQPVDWSDCPEPEGLPLPTLDTSISQRAQAADNLAVATFVKAYVGTRTVAGKEVRCSHPPRYSIVNFGLPDDVSHENGPHSDGMRKALIQTDQRQQILFDTLKQAGLFERTLIVLTSDHGQLLQDIQRSEPFEPALDQAGVRYVSTHAFIYLLTLDVELSRTSFTPGEGVELEVAVKDDDTGEPVEGATVTAESGASKQTAKTDAQGRATLGFTPAAVETRITVTDGVHTDFVETYR